MKWTSWAEWPKGHIVGASPENTTSDTHETREAAEAVCAMLRRDGLGGERCHFPVRTWVAMQCECGCDEFVWWIEAQGLYSSATGMEHYNRERHPGAVCRACNRDIRPNTAVEARRNAVASDGLCTL